MRTRELHDFCGGCGYRCAAPGFQLATLSSYAGTEALPFGRRAVEPEAGHGLHAMVSLPLPLMPLIYLALGVHPNQTGSIAVAHVLFAMVLLTISQRRRRMPLQGEVARPSACGSFASSRPVRFAS